MTFLRSQTGVSMAKAENYVYGIVRHRSFQRQLGYDAQLSPTCRLIGLLISTHAYARTGETFIDAAKLAEKSGMCVRTVRRAIIELIDRWIEGTGAFDCLPPNLSSGQISARRDGFKAAITSDLEAEYTSPALMAFWKAFLKVEWIEGT